MQQDTGNTCPGCGLVRDDLAKDAEGVHKNCRATARNLGLTLSQLRSHLEYDRMAAAAEREEQG